VTENQIKKPLTRSRPGYEVNVKMDVKEKKTDRLDSSG
jgi:ribosomal protein L19